ncbi:thiamine pyrophosphate protein [Caballeronia calidae]|uniref:Thiamine pyrophosphate protein n=1 Tax=Caballeronia calidae TaxID=1777139 RepID=A0A158EHV6_9BURK|nr:thiamine pyrophosphate-binding protein [Caballeronia calidae]SAL05477.1 thiamine pyrophosphate protein [Caballeronia calidae]
MTKTRGADLLAQPLLRAGVRQIFTLSGNHIMPVFDACFEAGIRLIHTRHEAAAVHMADSWARVTGEVGVAMVTGGPGHANAVSALYTARMAESPVVLLSGHAPNGQLGMGAFQEMDQAAVAAPLVKKASALRSFNSVPADVALALQRAKGGRPGPVQLNLPVDVLDATGSPEFEVGNESFEPPTQALQPAACKSIRRHLESASRPLILAGPAFCTRTGRQRIAELRKACGIPIVCTESPRGINDPSLGAFAEMLAEADYVLLLGKRLDFTLSFGAAPAFSSRCRFMQIDPEWEEIERTQRAVGDRLVTKALADPWAALDTIHACFAEEKRAADAWTKEVEAAVSYRPQAWPGRTDSGPLHAATVCAAVQPILDSDPDAVFVSDGGEFGQWSQACLSARTRVMNGVAGSIGAALPFAIAARLARPKAPVIATLGDGTFGFHASEMDTAVRYGLSFVAVVGNDACWNAEHQIQMREYGADRLVGCDLLPTRYDKVTEAFGGYGRIVTKRKELAPALNAALASNLPSCVNVQISNAPAPIVRRAAR